MGVVIVMSFDCKERSASEISLSSCFCCDESGEGIVNATKSAASATTSAREAMRIGNGDGLVAAACEGFLGEKPAVGYAAEGVPAALPIKPLGMFDAFGTSTLPPQPHFLSPIFPPLCAPLLFQGSAIVAALRLSFPLGRI